MLAAGLGVMIMAAIQFNQPGTAMYNDVMTLPHPGEVRLAGLLGAQFDRNEQERLLKVDEDELLDGYRKRPGRHPWIGEHVGKWLHAASLTWAATGNAALREKLDRVATGLMDTQEADGYLGTYEPAKRFGLFPGADWDVWSHKYCMIGLLTYYQFTGEKRAVETCVKACDLLLMTFGEGGKSIITAGTHEGMAATSVLEPVCLLYRATGEERFLAFAKRIVDACEAPDGPAIISDLMRERSVRLTSNAKAYEMLSNLVGLCELYRCTADAKYLDPVLVAWDDIVSMRLYVTGSGSNHEHWQDDGVMPVGMGDEVAETCVTVTWMQLNLQLLRLTGQPKYADQLERTAFNHLLAAQRPDGGGWCYFTPLSGTKPYGSKTNCCLSSGPRGIALLPGFAYGLSADGVWVNLYGESRAVLKTPGGGDTIEIVQESRYPLNGEVGLTIVPERPGRFALRLRVPEGLDALPITINDRTELWEITEPNNYISIVREWSKGDKVSFTLPLKPRLYQGIGPTEDRVVVMRGPLVLAADAGLNPEAPFTSRIGLDDSEGGPFKLADTRDDVVFETAGYYVKTGGGIEKFRLKLTPFYVAGSRGNRYDAYLLKPGMGGKFNGSSLFAFGAESRTRPGNSGGSIADDDPGTFVVTFNGGKADLDWYAVEAERPIRVNRVVFTQGRLFHDGGWFDSTSGKPRLEVRRKPDGEWEPIAVFDRYPSTTATSSAGLKEGDRFEVRFPPAEITGMRVAGRPAEGDGTGGAFSSCAELQAYLDKD